MSITFVFFEDMKIKIDRPIEIQSNDKMICIRAYEKLKGINLEDDWTREADELFNKYNIKYEIADEKEYHEFRNKANDFIIRL